MGVTIYTTNACPACNSAKDFFRSKNVNFNEINVEGNHQLQQELVERSGQLTVPVIDINGKLVVGFDRRRLMELLDL